MRRRFPGLRFSRYPNGVVAWEGEIAPANKTYLIGIACQTTRTPAGKDEILGRPSVEILFPVPKRREEAPDEEIPHLEYQGHPAYRSLCLYDAGGNEWHPEVAIAEMVPWISEWLL